MTETRNHLSEIAFKRCTKAALMRPAMHNLYLNLPWILDEKDYNCSSRTLAEWQARGSVNLKQGLCFSTIGSIYVIVYTLSLIGMFRAKLLHIPCYRLMFFNGFLDMMDIIAGSHIISYFHFTGGVFCTDVALDVFLGHFAWSVWMAVSVICVALAINRIVEMIPSMNKYRFLFKGKNVYIWMAASVVVFIVRPFVTRPMLYNSHAAALLFAPVIIDDLDWCYLCCAPMSSQATLTMWELRETDHYTPLIFPLHNISFPLSLVLLYSVLCTYVLKVKGFSKGKLDKVQLQLFLQSLLICTSTGIGSIFYVAVQFLPVPRSMILLSNVTWQLSHGIHGIVYMIVNKKIQGEVLKLFGFKGKPGTTTSVSSKPNTCKELELVGGTNQRERK